MAVYLKNCLNEDKNKLLSHQIQERDDFTNPENLTLND